MGEEVKKNSDIKFYELAMSAEEALCRAKEETIMGNDYFKAEDYDNALKHFNSAIGFFPKPSFYANRAATYCRLKKYNEAVSDYKNALKHDARNCHYIVQMGRCYSFLNKPAEALDCVLTVIKADPTNKVAQKLLKKIQKSRSEANPNKLQFKTVNNQSKIQFKTANSVRKLTNISLDFIPVRQEARPLLIPIPSTSKYKGPYYKTVYSGDPRAINFVKQMIHNSLRRVYIPIGHIESTCDDDDCLIIHILPTKYREKYTTDICNNNKQNLDSDYNQMDKDSNRNEIYKIEDTLETKQVQVPERNIKVRVDENLNNTQKESVVRKSSGGSDQSTIQTEDNARAPHKLGILLEKVQIHESDSQNDKRADHQDIGGGGEPCIEDRSQVNLTEVNTPFRFIQAWQSVRRDGTCAGFASILRNLHIDRITEVIGNKIDSTILSEILNCLYRYFMVADEVETVSNIFLNLRRLERFGIVIMFLSANDKRLVHNLLDFLKQHGKELPENIRKEYV